MLQRALGIDGRRERVGRGVKGDAKRIADDLKDMALMRGHRLMEQFMMPGEKRRERIGELLGERGAALNVGKQKSNGAGRAGRASEINNVTHSHLDVESRLVRMLSL